MALRQDTPPGPLGGLVAEMFPSLIDRGAAFGSVVNRVAPFLTTPGSGLTSEVEHGGPDAALGKMSPSQVRNAAKQSAG